MNQVTVKPNETNKEVFAFMRSVDPQNPTKDEVKQLKHYLATIPDLWRDVGDLVKLNQTAIIENVTSDNDFTGAYFEAAIEAQKADLGYADGSAIEKLLIEHCILCWLRWCIVEYNYTETTKYGIPIKRANFLEKKLSASQRRYLRSLESLARVRKLLGVSQPIQINVGEKQINISS